MASTVNKTKNKSPIKERLSSSKAKEPTPVNVKADTIASSNDARPRPPSASANTTFLYQPAGGITSQSQSQTPSRVNSASNRKKNMSEEQKKFLSLQLQAVSRNINKHKTEIKQIIRQQRFYLEETSNKNVNKNNNNNSIELSNAERINSLEREINELMDLYTMTNDGVPYKPSIELILNEFFEEYYYELDDIKRSFKKLSIFYADKCQLSIPGFTCRFPGKLTAIQTLLNMFGGLKICHIIDNVTVDGDPPSHCELFATCYSSITIENDTPRKVMEIFEIDSVTDQDTLISRFVISNQRLITLDSRPLYHLPEQSSLVSTRHDNWEPQFKPLDYDEQMQQLELRLRAYSAVQREADVDVDGESVGERSQDDGTGTATATGTVASADEQTLTK